MSTNTGTGVSTVRSASQPFSSYWTPSSYVVENAAPTNLVVTYAKKPKPAEMIVGNFAVSDNTISSITADATGKIFTFALGTALVYGDAPTLTSNGKTYKIINNVAAEAELTTYITGLSTPLSTTQKNDLNDLIKELKAATGDALLSTSWDYFKVKAGETSESSLKNLVKDAHHGVLQGIPAPAFTQFLGFKGDGSNGYIDEAFNPNTQGVAYTQNSASILVYITENISNDGIDVGCVNAANTARSNISCRVSTNVAAGRLNVNGQSSDANSIATGIYLLVRTASNVMLLYKNKIPGVPVTTASSAAPAYNHTSHARNKGGTVDAFSNRQQAIVAAGRGFNATEAGSIMDAIERYMDKKKLGRVSLDGIIQNASHCWFTRNRALYNSTAGKTWIGSCRNASVWANAYTQHIITLDDTTGAATSVAVGTVTLKDDHDEPSIILRSSDNKLVCAYSEHSKSVKVRWRVSTNALDATAWGDEQTFDANSNVSYCSLFEAANGDLFIFFREDTAGYCYIKSTDGGATFGDRVNFYKGVQTKPYCIAAQSPLDRDVIHFLVSCHPLTDNDTDVFAFYFDCGEAKFYKLDGTETTANMPFDAASDMTSIWSLSNPNPCWIEDCIVDSTGKPRYLMTYFPNGKNIDYATKDLYYAEWTGTEVTTPTKIHTALTRSMAAATAPNGEQSYPPVATFNVNDADEIIAPKETSNICELYKVTRLNATTFLSVQLTHGSNYDQWRPMTAKGINYNTFWLNKKIYDSYELMTESLMADKF